MKKFLVIPVLFFATAAHATPLLDLSQCLGQLNYDLLDDHPTPDIQQKIQFLHKEVGRLDESVIGEVHENAIVFSRSLEWTSMLKDPTAYNHIKTQGQDSCKKVLK